MKKILLSLSCILLLTACGSTKNNLIKKITKEDLTFINETEKICDTDLDVTNKIVLTAKKDNNKKYIGNYELYDCGDDAVYLTTSEGTYSIKDDTIVFIDQYANEIKFKVKSKTEIVQLDSSNKEIKPFLITNNSTETE